MEGRIENAFQAEDSKESCLNENSLKKYSNCTELFEEVCPYYISIGVTYEQFWDGDFEICRYARKAEKIRRDRANEESWISSIYIFRALLDASPAFHDFGDGKPIDINYSVEEPFPLTEKDAEILEKKKNEAKQEKMLDILKGMAMQHNKALREKQESEKKEQ